jgi:hypothetical protein
MGGVRRVSLWPMGEVDSVSTSLVQRPLLAGKFPDLPWNACFVANVLFLRVRYEINIRLLLLANIASHLNMPQPEVTFRLKICLWLIKFHRTLCLSITLLATSSAGFN